MAEEQGRPQGTGYEGHQGEHAPTEWIGSGSPPHDQDGEAAFASGGGDRGGSGGRTRWVAIGAGVAALAVVGGGAVFALQVLGGGGAQPDEAIPAGAFGYLRVDLDPSAEQKINAFRLLRRIPEFEKETGISADTDDLRRRFYEEVVTASGKDCPDYAAEVEPWLGDRAGLGAMAAELGREPDALAVLQVSDTEAAEEGLRAIAECTGEEDGGIAFVGEYALVAETQELADRFAAAAEEASLSEDADYTADMAALDDEGIVSGWLDVDAVVAEYARSDEDAVAAGLAGFSSVAMSVRAGADSLEVGLAADGVPAGAGEPAEAVQALPATTLFALGFSGGAEAIESGWSRLVEQMDETQPGAVQRFARELQAQTGLTLPDDVATLLGDDFALAVDSEGLEFDAAGGPDPSTIRVGVRTSNDIATVADLVDRIQTAITPFAALGLVEREVDGGSIIASSEAYADVLASDGGLGDSENYRAAVANPDTATAVFYLDFDRVLGVVDQIEAESGQPIPADDREALEVLRAFGLSASVDGDYTKANARLVFD